MKNDDSFDPIWITTSSGKISGRDLMIKEISIATGESQEILKQLPNKILQKKIRNLLKNKLLN